MVKNQPPYCREDSICSALFILSHTSNSDYLEWIYIVMKVNSFRGSGYSWVQAYPFLQD